MVVPLAIYVTENLPVCRCTALEFDSIESVWIEVQKSAGSIYIRAYYQPPGRSVESTNNFVNI